MGLCITHKKNRLSAVMRYGHNRVSTPGTRFMGCGQNIPPTVPSVNTLRKAKTPELGGTGGTEFVIAKL
jgi:hypothetical protein